MDLEAAADTLYGVPPEEFVELRSRLVTEARAAQDRESAKLIGQLRRPTRTGWLVNVLARAEAGRISDLLDLGRALGDAQQRRSGPDLRRLSNERRTTVDSLARRALELGRDLGYQAPDAAHQEVAQTLQAALGDPEVADLLRRGRLTQAISYGGFGMGAAAAEPNELDRRRAEAERRNRGTEAARVEAERVEAERVEAERVEAERVEAERVEAGAALEAGAAASERATAEADRLADQVESLRSQLAEAEVAEQTARTAARAARKHLADLRQAAEDADQLPGDLP